MNNTVFERNQKSWGRAISEGNLIYPDEQIIRFVKKHFYNPIDTTVLDFGCGGGRNTVALANEGYKVIAMDYNESAIKLTQEKCKSMINKNVSTIQNSGFDIPLLENSLDVVITDCFTCNAKEDNIKLVKNLSKVMKNNALLWGKFRTKKDSLYGMGIQLADGFYEMGEMTDRKGCFHYFADENDIHYIFSSAGLEIISIDNFSYTENNKTKLNSWYHVIVKKVNK